MRNITLKVYNDYYKGVHFTIPRKRSIPGLSPIFNLAGKERYAEALEILGKAEALGCANDYTISIKAKILRDQARADIK